ncbi:high affinity copper uptake protein 1-like [Venturia canescens]|uniref:high affinity copper uptake protein 1-like n=1 Tax=Venturia canescens TaxID=32260 RepID=UPI001C9C838E|nr:high affinity copper uptake protein 1-like [Venturia canescens]XP_043267319.1 high affinity copper uptake protein 1-like [Venturia canescens]XP_043267320.1 high affinity copper uptake protein 1-like [Venturia canescens]XP_043267322.1 high affinity copper uptake protein 1-like [Venturia canescens]
MMGMYFHFGVAETILFSVWRTTDVQGIVGSMIGIVLLAAIYEGLKNYREHLYVNTMISAKASGKRRSRRDILFSGIHFYQTILHMIQFVIGYFLMFIFMTYNVWLALATVIGTGLGYWLFSWNKLTSENNDCCG